MIYECKNIESHGSFIQRVKVFFGFKPKVDGANKKDHFALAEVSQEEIDALLFGLNDEPPSKNSTQPSIKKPAELEEKPIHVEVINDEVQPTNFILPSIQNVKLIGALIDAIETDNYENLTKEQINEAIDELTKIPVNKNLIQIVRGDIREDLKVVVYEHDISKTNDYFRRTLIELLESLLK